MTKPEISIILACYNEGSTFEKSVARIISVLEKIRKKWEIIFVEDKSQDDTRATIEKLTQEIKNSHLRPFDFAQGFGGQVRAIYHKKNQGRGRSVSDGIRAAKGNICGFLDVDLEVSESYIPLFIDEIETGYDLVVGRRFYEGGLKSLGRYLASKAYALLVKNLLGLPIDDTEAGYKFFRRSKILPLLSRVKSKHWFFDTEICARAYWEGLKISQVPVLFERRSDKKSTVRLVSDTWTYLTEIIKFRSQIPKRDFGQH